MCSTECRSGYFGDSVFKQQTKPKQSIVSFWAGVFYAVERPKKLNMADVTNPDISCTDAREFEGQHFSVIKPQQ